MVVYITKNLINGRKYIGKDSHNDPKYLGSGTLLSEDIKKYGKENFKKEILEYCISNEQLMEREIYWINYFNAVQSDDFYNLVISSGGWNNDILTKKKYQYVCNKISEKAKGKIISEQHREKIRQGRQADKGKPKPEGFGDKISKLKTGKLLSKEHCEKIRQGKLGKKQPQSFLDKKYKPIMQLDKENNHIQEFKSIEEAVNSDSKFKRSNISCCLIGFSKTAYGYKWIYK